MYALGYKSWEKAQELTFLFLGGLVILVFKGYLS